MSFSHITVFSLNEWHEKIISWRSWEHSMVYIVFCKLFGLCNFSCNRSNISFWKWTLRIKVHATLTFDSSYKLTKMSRKMIFWRSATNSCCPRKRENKLFFSLGKYSKFKVSEIFHFNSSLGYCTYPINDIRFFSDSENDSNSSILFRCNSQTNFGKQCSAITLCKRFSSEICFLGLASSKDFLFFVTTLDGS